MFYKQKTSMKKTASKSRIFTKVWKLSSLIVLAGLVGVACEREGNGSSKDGDRTSISLSRVSGAQQNRVKSAKNDSKLPKRKKLTWVASIAAPEERADLLWSATSVAVNPNNDKDHNLIYITWHSNRQATNPATAWGGALDVVDMSGNTPDLKVSYTSDDSKFNHVLVTKSNTMFLSATSASLGGAIARLSLSNGEEVKNAENVDLLGFPGVSVNAVTEYNNQLLAVSGYKGTYATFAADVQAQAYNYRNGGKKNVIEPAQEIANNFGGKYVVSADNKAYVLYNGETGAIIMDMDGNKVETNVALTSAAKSSEIFDDVNGSWELGEPQTYYGKHTMAIKGDYAYVAAGYNGLVIVNLSNKAVVKHEENIKTIGLCIDGNYLFASTWMGLRVYEIQEDGTLDLYAFEVEDYDETTGAPTSDYAATVGNDKRHSPNFVTYDPTSGYIYVAYGQSGVRVYKFTKEGGDTPETDGVDMGGGVIWATEDLPGYYAWGEIFNTDDAENLSYTSELATYENNASYYVYAQTNKKEFTAENYRFFDGSTAYTKYKLDKNAQSIDAKTILEADDDAASMRLGNSWRIPTFEEANELIKNCEIEQTEKDGVSGVLLTSKINGNQLFLPTEGYYNYFSGKKDGNSYWTSTLHTQKNTSEGPGAYLYDKNGKKLGRCYEGLAYAIQIYDNGYSFGGQVTQEDRPNGLKIRPVKGK